MRFFKEHRALRMIFILLFFLAGMGLVIFGWSMTGKLGGLALMLLGLGLLLAALLIYNKPFEEPKERRKRKQK